LNLLAVSMLWGQSPVNLRLALGGQQMLDSKQISSGSGWQFGGQFTWNLNSRIGLNLAVDYDHMYLQQDTVLLEWDWAYWDQRYIDWLLMGASAQEVDSLSRLLEYWRTDSSFHGVFEPHQWVQEYRFAAGIQLRQPITEKILLYTDLNIGFDRFQRRLKMVEDWMKVFKWSWDSLAYANGDYEENKMEVYQTLSALHEENPDIYRLSYNDSTKVYSFRYDYFRTVTHFAPNRSGTRYFAAPQIGLRYAINESVDLDFAYNTVFYLQGSFAEKLDDFFKTGSGEKWFPMMGKQQFKLGLTFKY
jgi:hypothetical protein